MSKPTIDDGGPAFPVFPGNGMSCRDWFAGMALPAVISGNVEACKMGGKSPSPLVLASDCYAIADAMIAEGRNHA